jgi:WD40 repeat protein
MLGCSAHAGEPPLVPILKVEVGTHTAMIRRLVLDEARERVVTAGDDKTVRIWNLRDGELIRTVHLPLGPAHEGQVNGLALSPDGRVVAAGGRTGWDLDGRAWLYLIDVATGRFTGRIDDLPEIICYLAYSSSGEYLAVGLCRDKGLRVYRTSDRVLIFSDTDFLDRIAGMDFARDGRLAVTSYGGDVRLYSPAFQRIARAHLDDGTQPTIVRFSPDGKNLAIGYLDAAVVTLMRAGTLEVTGRRRPQASSGPGDLPGVAWSADGRFVYAYGGTAKAENFVWRFKSSTPGGEVPLGRVHGRWTALEETADGGFVYAAEDPVPVWGRLAAGGQSVYERRPPVQDFAKLCGSLEVADDFAVRFAPSTLHPTHRVSFAPAQNFFGIAEASPVAAQRYKVSPTSTPALRTQEWEGTTVPRLNDRPLKLDPYEIARCVAVDERHLRVALGSEWTLRLFNSDAALIWAIPLSQVVRTVAFTPDGRFVVAGLSDGTLRWFRSSDGAEIVAALLHSDVKNWIAWTPDGYYNSSLEGDNFIGWHVNRGRDHAADFFRAVQFDRLLYRPDAVRAAYVEASPRPSVLAGIAFTPSSLNAILPPVIEAHATDAGAGHGYLDLDAELRGGPMQRLQVFVNGIPTLPVVDQVLRDPNAVNLHRRLEVPLAAGSNEIRVEIATPSAIGVGEAKLVGSGGGSPQSADLYVLAIGANRFDDSSFESLHFAVADAAGVVAAANRLEGAFHRVHALEVSDGTGGVSGKRVTEALRFLEEAGPDDTVVLFLASHGISDSRGNYYFVPSDANKRDAEKALEGANSADSLIRWTTFFDVLRTLPGRRIVIVDTCQSGYFGGTFDVTSLAKRSFTSHFALVAASKGDEESQGYPPGRHGLFTYGLLQSWLHPQPGRDAGTLDAVFRGAARFVADHSDTTQTPQLIAPPPLGQTRLSGMPLRVPGRH